MTLTLSNPWPAWDASVWRGRWGTGSATQDVLAVISAEGAEDISALQNGAQGALLYRGPGVLPLLAVEAIGSGVAWIYPYQPVVSLAMAQGSFNPRAISALVQQVAIAVQGFHHPGPLKPNILIDDQGSVVVAGFVGPPDVVASRIPGGRFTEAAQVYQLGALMIDLLAAPVRAGSDKKTHEASIRRGLINAMCKPGTVFDDQYAEWIRHLLAWDPSYRPHLSRVIDGFGELANTTGGPSLEAVVQRSFQTWLREATHVGDGLVLPVPWMQSGAASRPGQGTLSDEYVVGDLLEDDDPTMDSESGFASHTPPSIIERGAIPVSVGPPAEEASKRPTLPVGFLESDRAPVPAPEPLVEPTWKLSLLMGLVGLLFALAIGYFIWM